MKTITIERQALKGGLCVNRYLNVSYAGKLLRASKAIRERYNHSGDFDIFPYYMGNIKDTYSNYQACIESAIENGATHIRFIGFENVHYCPWANEKHKHDVRVNVSLMGLRLAISHGGKFI